MRNKYGIYRYRNLSKIIVLSILYVLLNLSIGFVNRFFAAFLGPVSLAGVVTGFMFIIATGITILNYDMGGNIAIVLISLSTISASKAVLQDGNLSAMQGVCFNLAGLIAICLMKRYLSYIFKISYTDEVTGLRNRRSILEYINNQIHEKKKFYVLYLNLKDFRFVNETSGHEGGDDTLKQVAARWSEVDNEGGALGRIGGDEFIAVVPYRENQNIENIAQAYIDKIKDCGSDSDRNSDSRDKMLLTSVNVGISFCPVDAKTVNEIIQFADLAMYNARKTGRNTMCRYNVSYNDTLVKERLIEKSIRKALDEDLFYMVYQPQFFTKTKKLRGFEALIRLNALNGENIGPATFIPIADRSDLIIEIGEFVMKRTMTELSRIVKERDITLSINVSPRQIMSPNFADVLSGILSDTGFPADKLEVEITESVLMDDTDVAVSNINRIKEMGIRLAMDDFGTGYSSLSYLTRLPIDVIKIDKSIIDSIHEGEIVKAIITMGHALGCEIISEGVEVENQLEILKSIDNDIIQGFIWGGPLKVEEVYKLVSEE